MRSSISVMSSALAVIELFRSPCVMSMRHITSISCGVWSRQTLTRRASLSWIGSSRTHGAFQEQDSCHKWRREADGLPNQCGKEDRDVRSLDGANVRRPVPLEGIGGFGEHAGIGEKI